MSLFEITIQRKDGDAWPVVARHQPGDGALVRWSRERLALALADLDPLLPSQEEYGLRLGQALFCAGRNLTQAEWQLYFPGEDYCKICDQWPVGE